MSTLIGRCECYDPACAEKHQGRCESTEDVTVHRIDTDDSSVVKMCAHCAQDAVESGAWGCNVFEKRYNRRAERSREDHVTRLKALVEAADKLAQACSRLDLTDQMYQLEKYYDARSEYRLDHERSASSP